MASAVINQVSCPSLGLTRAAGYLNESASDRKISFTMARLLCPAIRKVTCAAAVNRPDRAIAAPARETNCSAAFRASSSASWQIMIRV